MIQMESQHTSKNNNSEELKLCNYLISQFESGNLIIQFYPTTFEISIPDRDQIDVDTFFSDVYYLFLHRMIELNNTVYTVGVDATYLHIVPKNKKLNKKLNKK